MLRLLLLPSHTPQPVVIRSLQRWLQSTVLLAVLAGYGLLLSANVGLSMLQRRQSHKQLVQQVLQAQDWQRDGLQHRSSLYPGTYSQSPRLERTAAGTWLVSITPLPAGLSGGRRQSLVLRQDVSDQIERERLTQLLLLLAAGGSTLFTSALLRPVLRQGLVEPLRQLSEQLGTAPLPPLPPRPVDVERQPLELKSIASAFNAMQVRLGASWEQQRAFVDGVAHELRTPLTLISGHAQSLQRHAPAAATAEAATSLQLIAAESQRMGLLVSDLLDLARRDAGRLELRLAPLNPEDALLEGFERFVASSRGRLQLLADDEVPAPPAVLADAERLQQCLAVLIDNALRYSPAPRPVQLHVESTAGAVVLHVRDHGPGVADDERERIFERFVRGTASAETRGSGIGLSIVRLLMEAMGGGAGVVPAPGGGADFQLRLRRACASTIKV
ncbi:MAG: HAMP domain-containing sensor histidine kinase [Cyanobacteriota bacterium]|nr:HAMP domain-containing sensor histidine kinase [Cyanobacteriota bacterium]